MNKLLQAIKTQIGVEEDKAHTNKGAQVEAYQQAVGLGKGGGYAWCQALVYWCGLQAYGAKNPVPKTGGVMECYRRAKAAGFRVLMAKDTTLQDLKEGMQVIFDFGGGRGHTGIISGITGTGFKLISGNTNDDGSRDGYKVVEKGYSLKYAKLHSFIDYPDI